ncbi:MAG: flavin reductase [Conexibacter sp.]|nr:flavin reductase [Conexibacter sp.]
MSKHRDIETSYEDGLVTGWAMRKALSRFVSGVTIVTTADGEGHGAEVHGMTANAFTSVSLDPPLVLVSIARKARMDAMIRENGRYGVSILCKAQEPHSMHFAGRPMDEEVSFHWRGGVPFLEDALAHLACTVYDSHAAGDHTLHVGHVDGLWYGDGDPLVFYTGGFRALELVRDDVHWM